MPIQYVSLDEAIKRDGLRMVVVSNIPSPWGEAAKGIFHVKGLDWAAVRLDYASPALQEWAGQRSGPVAIYNNEKPRALWSEILLLAERLAPEPALIPSDPFDRALMFGLSHEICGECGLGWERRLELIHTGGFEERAAGYLARKYGYFNPETGAKARARVIDLLGMLGRRLQDQRSKGSAFYIGNAVTAVDIYSAAFMAFFDPLPPEQCPMQENLRTAFSSPHEDVRAALDLILLEHRDLIYRDWLELPLSL